MKARQFYLEEAIKSNWSTRQLERQINTFFYERLLSSKNKSEVAEEINRLEAPKSPEDIIRDPYVLEFLGLNPNENFYESDLEQALITHLQKFLLELGRGFSFVARQKRITFDGRHFWIDLVFYNYILKCFILVELKTGPITHQDIGQMDMYVRMFDDLIKDNSDNPTLGIVLCSETNADIAKYSILKGNEHLFATKYKLYLPNELDLKAEIEHQKQIFYSQQNEEK